MQVMQNGERYLEKSFKKEKSWNYLGGVSRGFTPGTSNGYLTIETSQSGSYSWYAKQYGKKVDSGTSSGGTIVIGVE